MELRPRAVHSKMKEAPTRSRKLSNNRSMSRRTAAIGFALVLAACNRPNGGGAPTERNLGDDASVGFDLVPVSNGTASQWFGTYASQGKIAKFRIELGKARAATSDEGRQFKITSGEGRFVPEPGSDSTVLLIELRKALQAKTEVQPALMKTTVTFTFAKIGDNLSQAEGGGFAANPTGNWTALKLFFGEGDQESEVFLNINPRTRKGQFSIKDPDYGDLVLKELSKVL